MRKLAIFGLLCAFLAVGVFGQTPSGGYSSPGQSSSSGGNSSGAWSSTYDLTAAPYSVVPNNGQACMDGGTTSTTATVTTQGSCNFKCPGGTYPCTSSTSGCPGVACDAGKQIIVTTVCSSTGCGPYFYMTSINILGATQLTLVTISSIQSATSLTASGNAAQTCTFSGSAGCAIVIGVDITTALNAALSAGLANTAVGCPTILVPQGIFFFSSQWTSKGSSSNQCIGAGGAAGHIQQLGIIGPTIRGTGQLSSVLVPAPNIQANLTSCSGFVAGGNGWAFEDMTITGFGQSYFGASAPSTCSGLVTGFYFHNFQLTGWAERDNGQIGVQMPGYSLMSDSYINAGANGGNLYANGSFISIVNSSLGGYQALIANGTPVVSNGNSYYGPSLANVAAIDVSSGILVSSADFLQKLSASGETSATPFIQVENGATLDSSFFVATGGNLTSDTALKIIAGGKAIVTGWNTVPSLSAGVGLNNAGTFIDNCANNFNGASNTNTGSIFGSCSTTGTTITAAKLLLSGGWGGSGAWSALTGSTIFFQGTITASGTTSASPTITETFPTPFLGTPTGCQMIQVGGTQPGITQPAFTPGSVSSAGVTYTYNGTPTTGDTLIVQGFCYIS